MLSGSEASLRLSQRPFVVRVTICKAICVTRNKRSFQDSVLKIGLSGVERLLTFDSAQKPGDARAASRALFGPHFSSLRLRTSLWGDISLLILDCHFEKSFWRCPRFLLASLVEMTNPEQLPFIFFSSPSARRLPPERQVWRGQTAKRRLTHMPAPGCQPRVRRRKPCT